MKIILILIICHNAVSKLEFPKIHDMTDNPGLLPLKLGTAQNKVNSWSFIQILDISKLIEEFKNLQIQYVRIKNAFENNTTIALSYKKSFCNSYNLAQSLETKITIQINQLNPLFKIRQKRGLINGLGSILKTITGNLDQEDAQRYDNAIKTLSSNQMKIKTLVKDQISLLDRSIQTFQNNIQNLTNNQILLETRIDKIEDLLYKLDSESTGTYYFFFVEMTISQVVMEFQIIYDLLEKIEVAISFSKLNTLHNSIIETNDLLTEIGLISEHLVNNKLPFEPKLENILPFEKIIEIKSYSKENQIIFIIDIPIVEKENYDYFHLYTLPIIMHNNSSKMIIPQTKFLVLNEQSYFSFNTPCKEIIPEEFICHETNPTKITEDSPCEIQLLKFSVNLSNCQLVPVKIQRTIVQKLELNKWIVVIPDRTVAIQKCGNNRENIPLKGSYLLELNPTCEIIIGDILIRNFENSKEYYKLIVLPKIDFNHPIYKTVTNFKPINLNSIELSEIASVKGALEAAKRDVQSIEDSPITFNNINGWTIVMYIIVILIILFLLFKFYSKTRCQKAWRKTHGCQPQELQEIPSIHPGKSEVNPRILH